jgi:hypothetical protein
MSATIIEFEPNLPDGGTSQQQWAIDKKLWDALLGMTSRQSEMAFKLCFKSRERSRETRAALSRYIEALRFFEPALAAYREELLKNMELHCPRAAKRIREGRPPRLSRKRA